jgi:hypothetical protein
VGYLVTVNFISALDHPEYTEQLTAQISEATATATT